MIANPDFGGTSHILRQIDALGSGPSPDEVLHASAVAGKNFVFPVSLDMKFFLFPFRL